MRGSVLVDGDDLPDRVDPGGPAEPLDRLAMVPAVVVGVVSEPAVRRPEWADLVVAPDSPELAATLATVAANPLASIDPGRAAAGRRDRRTVAQGLVAESMAYGLLQAGPEFASWRAGVPVRDHPGRGGSTGAGGPGPAIELSITLNRPHVLNAFNAPMRDELVAALQVAVARPVGDRRRGPGGGGVVLQRR